MFGPLNCKAGTSKKNKTGAWRVELRPKYLHQNCIACKLCVTACPEGCIIPGEKNAFEFDAAYCKGCGLCAAICPKKDIAMVKEEEQKSK